MDINIERKPTKVECKCKFCNKPIMKGKIRLVIKHYGYRNEFDETLYSHPICMIDYIESKILDICIDLHELDGFSERLEAKEKKRINPSRRTS